MPKANNFFECDYDSCTYKTKRKDNLKVHVNEKHKKILKTCIKCGERMTQSSLCRHKRLDTCVRMMAIQSSANQIQDNGEENLLGPIQNSIDSVMDVKVKIETTISIAKHNNGSFTVSHSGIQLGGLTLYLTTQKPEGKKGFNCVRQKMMIVF